MPSGVGIELTHIRIAGLNPSDIVGEPFDDGFRIGTATNHEFTERELDILKELTTGATNAEIAEKLGISVATVKIHIQHLMDKTCFKTRTELASEARRLGIVIKDKKE